MIETYFLYLNSSGAQLRRSRGLFPSRDLKLVSGWEWDAVTGTLDVNLPRAPWGLPSALHLVLGSSLCHFMAVELPEGLRDGQERVAFGRAKMQAHLSLVERDWEYTLDVSSDHRAIVCAARRDVLQRVRAICAEKRTRLVSCRPLIAGVWNALQRTPGWAVGECGLVAVEDDAFTLMGARDNVIETIHSYAERCTSDLLKREAERLSLSFGDKSERVTVAASKAMANLLQVRSGIAPLQVTSLTGGVLHPNFSDLLCQEHT